MMNHNCPHKSRPHHAKGLCKSCYTVVRYHFYNNAKSKILATQQKIQTKKYHSDNEFRQKRKNAQIEYRKKHPDRYNYMMARHYFRKLTAKQKTMLLEEVKKT